MAENAHYDKAAADYAVGFIECLCHTKGTWAGKPFELIDWQERIIRDIFGILKPNGYRQFNTAYVEIPKKQGKQLALDTKIPTPEGFTTMGDIRVGDTVFDENGQPCRVVAKSDVDDTEQAYRLTFRDGSSIVAGERHLWNVDYIIGAPRSVLWTTGEIYHRTKSIAEPCNIGCGTQTTTRSHAAPSSVSLRQRRCRSREGTYPLLAPVFIIWQILSRSKNVSPCSASKWTAEAIVIW